MEKETISKVMAELGRRSWAVRKERHGKNLVKMLSKAGKLGGRAKAKAVDKQPA